MLENIIKDVGEKAKLFDAIHTVPSIKSMADWTFKWIESDKSFAHRLVAFAIVEGVFFSGAFASIFWIKIYKGNNIMPGLLKSNELIARDEGMHCEFACLLYKYVINKLTDKQIGKIMREAVVIAQGFMQDALPVRLIGMNQDFMNDYIEYIGDRLLMMLGHGKIYNKKNPLEFMDTIAFANKGDFFVFRNTEYQDPHINNETKNTDFTKISDDF
jgi:ribonucleoside-diphosphate reductase beta chain